MDKVASNCNFKTLQLTHQSFDNKLDALAKFTVSVVENRGQASQKAKIAFFDAGYTEENLIDAILIIGNITISNYTHSVVQFPIDFHEAPELESLTV